MGAGASSDTKNNKREIATSSEETSFCDACQVIDDVTSVAVYYCEECRHGMCNDCHDYHRKTLATRRHKVIKLQDIKGRESTFQISGRRPNEGTADVQVSGRRPNEGASTATSNLQVSGRRPYHEGAVREKKETGEDQSTDITHKVQRMSIFPRLDRKPTTDHDRAGTVYKTATMKKGLNVSLESDVGLCDITGFCLLQDRLIVCDRANSKLKVFDSNNTFQFEYTCNKAPWGIGMLDTTTVVVSCIPRGMKVLSVGRDSMTELVNVNTHYPSWGVCCHDRNIYCVVSKKSGSGFYSEIRVYSPDGTLKRKFDYLSDGKVDCNRLKYITVNPHTGIIYVTDWDKGVLALSTNGDVIAVMSPPQLKFPEGITVDEHGQIYVCGVNSYNVIRMSADGGYAEAILPKSPRCARAQCVKIYGNKMYFARRRRETVFVYELS